MWSWQNMRISWALVPNINWFKLGGISLCMQAKKEPVQTSFIKTSTGLREIHTLGVDFVSCRKEIMTCCPLDIPSSSSLLSHQQHCCVCKHNKRKSSNHLTPVHLYLLALLLLLILFLQLNFALNLLAIHKQQWWYIVAIKWYGVLLYLVNGYYQGWCNHQHPHLWG